MIEPGIYKEVMGSFPSGVTVVTTLDAEGGIVGITASAFSALSIDPALSAGVILTTFTDCIGFATLLGLGTLFLT